ncbi:MAG: Rieske 2Fe-2S domain-containing protein [Ignavibacteriae bacterium]|nr:Rieske 2Fe-2S domain-containing protein [Ignavibacteria bacterium]MBI3364547.1 Rieske 2Fe-2S domain-containing protein [Ignavibacteriota bacterium]
MDRKEFLSILGIGTAAIVCGTCMDGCKQEDAVVNAPTNVDFTLDLSDPANSSLQSNGGYLYKNGVIVARTGSGAYIAVSMACTHQGTTVQYDLSNNRFHCPLHGSNFATDGTVINGPASSPLKKYNTTLSGTSLRVFS